jgi:protocatechuate 3,4-dioxygenase beta subunit
MKSALAVLFLCAGLGAQQGSIEGVTVNSLTQEPIAGVHVTLLAATNSSVTAVYGAISDRDGHFSIATIRPGMYMIQTERTGFLFDSTKAQVTRVAIRAGQQLTGFRVELVPHAILSGRVLDDHGDPVQGVYVMRIGADEKDQANSRMHNASLPTDDRGEFRMVILPGRYYLESTGPISGKVNEKPEQRDGVVIAPLRPTYYPSTIVIDRATTVEAVAGKETGGLEIRLSRQVGTSISGVIRGVPDPSIYPTVFAQWGSTSRAIRAGTDMTADRAARFAMRDAEAGLYRLYAYWPGKPPMVSAVTEIQVGDADVTNLELTLGPTAEITGIVEVEGDPPGVDRPKRTVRLEGASGFGVMPPSDGATDGKGAFTLSGIAPARYRVRVTPLPDDGYVRNVVVDGTESPDDMLDVSAAVRSARIKVMVARDGAQITGRVLDENGDGNPLGYVLLSPVPVPKDTTLQTTASVEPDGTYRFKSLRPGTYRILAVDPLRHAGKSSSEMSKMLLEKGQEIELQPRAHLQRDLRPLPK